MVNGEVMATSTKGGTSWWCPMIVKHEIVIKGIFVKGIPMEFRARQESQASSTENRKSEGS